MQVFVTGATGYIGFAVSAALRRAGYRVWGLARSETKARRLAQHEIEPVIGDLADPKTYLDVASECALLVHTGFDYSANGVAKDRTAIDTLLEAGCRGALLVSMRGNCACCHGLRIAEREWMRGM